MASARRHKRHNHNRGRFGFLYKVLSILLVIAALTVGCVVFFRVKTIEVTGNVRYTAQEVIEVTGIETDDFLFGLNTGEISRQIRSQLPYVEAVNIRRGLPDRLEITVTESKAAAAVETDGVWWLISPAGKLLEGVNQNPAGCMAVTGLTLVQPQTGQMAMVDEEHATRLRALLELIEALEQRSMLENVLSLDCSSKAELVMEYTAQFTVKLLINGDFSKNMNLLQKVIQEESERVHAIVDFTVEEGRVFVRSSE